MIDVRNRGDVSNFAISSHGSFCVKGYFFRVKRMRESPTSTPSLQASCPNCWKSDTLCVCASTPDLNPGLRFLILQHPREVKNPKGSARLLSLAIPTTVHRVGLSWRSLAHALGKQEDQPKIIPQEWAVLYVGTQKDSGPPKPGVPFELRDRKGKMIEDATLQGIILLDGNWKQSKTLWWRNPWLLKLNRVVLNPQASSRYGTLRKQPRERCLSTLEAAAESLNALGETEVATALNAYFETFLSRLSGRP